MSLRSRWLAACAAVVLAGPALAQSPLAIVPAGSPIVVQVRGWERTLARVNATIKAAAPDYAQMITGQLEAGIAQALMGRELKGLAKEGPLFVVFTEVPTGGDDVPEMAVVVRVANYVQFRDAFLKEDERKELKARNGYEITKIDGQESYFLSKGDWAVVSPSEKVVKRFQDKKVESLVGKLDKKLEAKLLGSDVSVLVDVKAIFKQYGDQIASAKALMQQGIEQAETAGGLDKAQLEMAKKMFDGVFQLAEDSELFVAALDFPPEGFSLKLHTQVGDKSKTNELLKGVRASAPSGIGNLPGGAMIYAGGSTGQEWMKVTGLLGAQGGAKTDPAVEAAMKDLQKLAIDSWMTSVNLPASGVQVFRYQDPAKAVEGTLKLYKAVPADSGLGGMAIKGKPEIKESDQKLGGFTFHSIKLTFDLEKTVENLPEAGRDAAKAAMEKMIGPDQHTWFGSDGKSFVQVTAKDWDGARKLLEGYFDAKGSLSTDASFAEAMKRLPAQSALAGLIDAARYAHAIADALGEALGGLPGKPEKPEGKPAYVGFAVGLEPGHASFDLWMPAEGVKAVLKVLGPLLGGLGG